MSMFSVLFTNTNIDNFAYCYKPFSLFVEKQI